MTSGDVIETLEELVVRRGVSAITQSAPPDNHLLALKVHHLRM
jgi:hypothetical protein